MLVTVTEYANLARDGAGSTVPLGGDRIASQKATAAGTITLDGSTRFVRIATDTKIHVKPTGTGAADIDELIPANAIDYLATRGTSLSFIAAA